MEKQMIFAIRDVKPQSIFPRKGNAVLIAPVEYVQSTLYRGIFGRIDIGGYVNVQNNT